MSNNTLFTVREESCWLPSPEYVDWKVDIVVDGEKTWLVGVPARNRQFATKQQRRQFAVEFEWVQGLWNKLASITIPALPEPIIGYDGGYTELIVEGRVRYRWWSAPPKGWEPLDELADEVLKRFHNELEVAV